LNVVDKGAELTTSCPRIDLSTPWSNAASEESYERLDDVEKAKPLILTSYEAS
jgi:hypothetical protein